MMPDYIRMFVYHNLGKTIDFVSEVIVEETTAEHFAKCFAHNYNCQAYVRKVAGENGYIVFADNVDSNLVHVNISSHLTEGLFANWKFESRQFNRR